MEGRRIAKRGRHNSAPHLAYIVFETAMSKVIRATKLKKLKGVKAFAELIHSQRFFISANLNRFAFSVDWQTQNGSKKVLVEIKAETAEKTIKFIDNSYTFLTLTCNDKDEMVIERDLPFSMRT